MLRSGKSPWAFLDEALVAAASKVDTADADFALEGAAAGATASCVGSEVRPVISPMEELPVGDW